MFPLQHAGCPHVGYHNDIVVIDQRVDVATQGGWRKIVLRMARKQCVLLLVLAIATPCHVTIASPVSPPSTSDVDLLMPSVQPQVVRR